MRAAGPHFVEHRDKGVSEILDAGVSNRRGDSSPAAHLFTLAPALLRVVCAAAEASPAVGEEQHALLGARLCTLGWHSAERTACPIALHNSAFSPAPGNDLSKKSAGPTCYCSGAEPLTSWAKRPGSVNLPCARRCLSALPGTTAAMPQGPETKSFGPALIARLLALGCPLQPALPRSSSLPFGPPAAGEEGRGGSGTERRAAGARQSEAEFFESGACAWCRGWGWMCFLLSLLGFLYSPTWIL